jgi:hypothetical protein
MLSATMLGGSLSLKGEPRGEIEPGARWILAPRRFGNGCFSPRAYSSFTKCGLEGNGSFAYSSDGSIADALIRPARR